LNRGLIQEPLRRFTEKVKKARVGGQPGDRMQD
jgi:hypothetical protein